MKINQAALFRIANDLNCSANGFEKSDEHHDTIRVMRRGVEALNEVAYILRHLRTYASVCLNSKQLAEIRTKIESILDGGENPFEKRESKTDAEVEALIDSGNTMLGGM